MMRLKGLRTISELILSSSLYVALPMFIMVVLLMSGGCMKTDSGKISEDGEIKFTVGSMPSTKTAYTKEDKSLQLIWVTGDQVSIFCDQAGGDSGKTKADYDVTPIAATPERGTLSKAAKEGEKGLRWNDDKTKPHYLYAVYPSIDSSKKNVSKVSEGFFTFDFPKTQYCGTDGEYVLGTKHRLKPQMYLAYMVAKQDSLMPTNKPAVLQFKPIATTLEITLQGATQGDVVIGGLQLSVKNIAGQYVMDNSGKSTYQIQFDATKDFSIDVSNSLEAYTSGSVATANFEVKLLGGGNYTLKARESVTFTVFLPPIKNLKDVDVTCLDGNGVSLGTKVILTTAVANPASKSFIKMPPFDVKLNIRPISVLFSKEIIELQHDRSLSYEVTSNGTKLDNNRIKDIRWELVPIKGDFVTLSSDTSQTPNLLYKNDSANEYDYAELILSGIDEFGRKVADTISVLVCDLPAWRFAEYNYGSNSSHAYNTNCFYRASDIYDKKEVINGLEYHCPTTTECWGIVMYRNFTDVALFQTSSSGEVANEIVTYGQVSKMQYTASYWNIERSTGAFSLGSKGYVNYDCYGIKLYTSTNYQHACAYRYKWDSGAIGGGGKYCEVKAFYIGRKAKYFLKNENRVELKNLIESAPYSEEFKTLIFPAWGVHQYYVGTRRHSWIEKNEHGDYWLKRDITTSPQQGWAVDVMSFRQDKPCMDERLNASGDYHPWSIDREVYHWQPVRFCR